MNKVIKKLKYFYKKKEPTNAYVPAIVPIIDTPARYEDMPFPQSWSLTEMKDAADHWTTRKASFPAHDARRLIYDDLIHDIRQAEEITEIEIARGEKEHLVLLTILEQWERSR